MLDIRIDPSSSGALPIYRQLADQIQFLIRSGDLADGTRLSSTRDLARQLGISRGAVVQAYEVLCSLDLCTSHVGQGTIVLAPADASALQAKTGSAPKHHFLAPDEPLFDDPRSLLPSLSDTAHLPIGELRQSFNRVLRYPALLNTFRESAGDLTLRKLICERILPARGIDVRPEEVIVVPGSQYGSMLIALALRESRTTLHFGAPGYLGIPRNFARFGYTLQGHAVDGDGIRLDTGCLNGDDLLYLMPEHHFPQCVTLDDARRRVILEQIESRDLLVVEDDYDSEFYYDRQPQPALKAVAAGRNVIYMGTFSKALFNSVRLGYMVADAGLVQELAALHWSLSRGTNGLIQRWVSELLVSGALERHIKRMRNVYRRKRDSVAAALARNFPEWRFEKPGGGLQFFIELESVDELHRVLMASEKVNVAIGAPWTYTVAEVPSRPFIVMGIGAMTIPQIQAVLAELRHVLRRLA